MVIDDNTLGGGWIPNPKYNKKTKKLGEQPFIQSQEAGGVVLENAAGANFYNANPSLAYTVRDARGRVADTRKYIRGGVTPNRIDNLDDALADSQSTWSRIWNAGKQTFWSQLILGTAQGLSDIAGGLASAAHYVGTGGGNGDWDYNNAMSDYLEKARQQFDENNPIYVRSDANWYDPSSIISHIPAIAGIASMVIPSTGVVKGISLGGRALGAGRLATRMRLALTGMRDGKRIKELSEVNKVQRALNSARGIQTQNAAAQLTANGIVNASMWSYAEARGVYNQMYADASEQLSKLQKDSPDEYGQFIQNNQQLLNGVDTNNPDEVAKRVAGASADRTFGQDMLVNSIFSTLQYYGLRNVWSGIKNGPTTAALRQLQRERLMTAGMTQEEAKKAISNVSFWNRAKNYVGDKLIANKNVLTSQITGGAQMAAVSFGRNEGLNYGQVLLGEKPASSFDDRLNKYIASPEMWEETLWGMLAGTAFHFVGSAVKLGGKKVEAAIQKKRLVDQQDTQEAKEKARSLFAGETADEHRRKAAMMSTSEDFDNYVQIVNKITREHKNPFDADDHGNFKDIEPNSDAEQQLLRQAEDQFLSNRVIKSISSGTLNLERAYMESEEVRKALVKRGITDEEHSVEVQKRILDKMDSAERNYDNYLTHTMNEIGLMNARRSKDKQIPMQYAYHIAEENTRRKMMLGSIDDEINRLRADTEQTITELKADGKLPQNVDYYDYYDTIVTGDQLGELYAEKTRLEKTGNKDASTIYSLGRINDQIDILENKLKNRKDATSDQGIGRTLWVMNHARAFEYNEDGKLGINTQKLQENTSRYFSKTDDALVTNGDAIIKDLGLQALGEEQKEGIRKSYGYYAGRYSQAQLGKDRLQTIEGEIGKGLSDKLTQLSFYDNAKSFYQRDIAWTRNELAHKFNELDTQYNEARVKTIQQAVDTIRNINTAHTQEGQQAMNMLDLMNRFMKGEAPTNFGELSTAEQNQFRDAMNILNLTNVDNRSILAGLRAIIARDTLDAVNARTQANKDNAKSNDTTTNSENTTTNQNGSQSTQNQQPINSTQDGQQSQGTQAEQPQGTTAQPTTRKARVFRLDVDSPIDDNGVVSFDAEEAKDNNSADDNAVRLVETDTEGEYELVGNGKNLPTNVISSSDLYDIKVQPVDGGVPTENPIVKYDDKLEELTVVSKGTIDKPQEGQDRSDNDINRQGTTENEGNTQPPVKEESDGTTRPTQFSSTGEQEPTTPAPAQGYEADDIASEAERQGGGDVFESEQPTEAPAPPKKSYEETDEFGHPVSSQTRYAINNACRQMMGKAKAGGAQLSSQYMTDRLVEQLLNGDAKSDPVIAAQIDKGVSTWMKLAQRLGVETKDDRVKLIDDVALMSSSVTEQTTDDARKTARENRNNAIKKLIDRYAKDIKADKVDGKILVTEEGLLRYCNEHTDDRYMAEVLYDAITDYLNNEGKDHFTTEDISETRDDSILVNLQKTRDERLKELSQEVNGQRLNTNDLLDRLVDKSEKQKLSDTLDKLNVGDVVDVQVVETNKKYGDRRLDFFANGGVKIGEINVPTIDPITGRYVMKMYGTCFVDVGRDGNGNLKSAFLTSLKSWVGDTSTAGKDLNDILVRYRYAKNNTERNALWTEFKNNDIAKKAAAQGMFQMDEQALKYISNLWNYTRQAQKLSESDINALRRQSIDMWGARLLSSYDTMNAFAENPNAGTIKISKVSDGEIIYNKNDRGTTYEDCTPVSDAIGGTKKGAVRIGVVNPNTADKTDIAGFGQVTTYMRPYSTNLMIPNRNGTWDSVHAYGRRFEEASRLGGSGMSETGTKVVNAFIDEVNKCIDELAAAKTDVNKAITAGNKLRKLFNDAFYTTGNSLFEGIKVYPEGDGRGFHISAPAFGTISFKFGDGKGMVRSNYIEQYNGADRQGFFFTDETQSKRHIDSDPTKSTKYDVAHGEALNLGNLKKAIERAIRRSANFRIATDYVGADIDGRKIGGLAHNEDGRFHIKIGDQDFDFDSYNSFLIDNNLLRVNTHIENGSNYRRVGERNQANNQTVEIKMDYSSPVKKGSVAPSQTTQTKPTKPQPTLQDRVKDKLAKNGKSNQKNTGRAIATEILGKDFVKQTKIFNRKYSLFPKNVIFDDRLSVNAQSNVGNAVATNDEGVVFQPHQVVVGNKFMQMLETPEGRQQAVRKLMHEQLHLILHDGNEQYIDRIREVYSDFAKAIENEPADAHIREYLFKKNYDADGNLTETALEEFLVESLTSKELVDKLNSIKVNDVGKQGKISLLDKILNLIGDLFGWKVENGSLRQKEVNLLSDVFEKVKTEVKEEVKPVEKQTVTQPVEKPTPSQVAPPTQPANRVKANQRRGRSNMFKSSVTEVAANGHDIPTYLYDKVSDNALFNSLSDEQKSAYKRMEEAGLISITCHV